MDEDRRNLTQRHGGTEGDLVGFVLGRDVWNWAADGFGFWLRDGLVGEDGVEGVFEVVGGYCAAAFAEGDVLVVDTSTIDDLALWGEDDRLGRDGGAGFFDPVVARIEDDGGLNVVFAGVLFGFLGGDVGIGVNEQEMNALSGEGFVQAVDFGEEGVGDGAVGEDEDEGEGFCGRIFGGAEIMAVESYEGRNPSGLDRRGENGRGLRRRWGSARRTTD